MAVVTFKVSRDDKDISIARQASALSLLVCLEKDGVKKVSIIEKTGAKHTVQMDFDDALDLWIKAMKKPNVGTYRFHESNAQGWGPIAVTSDHITGIEDVDGKVTMKLKNGAEVHLVQTIEEAVQRWTDSLAH
jgi:hypothetical protein